MAQASKTNQILSAIAGVAFTASTVLTPTAATAQDATHVGTSNVPNAEEIWTDELRELRVASDATRDYAENNVGVGILVHVGQDIPNQHFATADLFGQKMVEIFEKKFGVEARYFLSPNYDAPATGITYHIDTFIHGADNGTEVKNVKEALAAMPEVVEYLKIAKRDQLAQLEPTGFDFDN